MYDCLSKLGDGVKYFEDISKIRRRLKNEFQRFMLEKWISDIPSILNCFIDGTYYYDKNGYFSVYDVHNFLRLLQSSTEEKSRVILANLHSRLDSLPRADKPAITVADFDDVPF